MVESMPKQILLVDDERFVLESLCRMLQPQRSAWNLVCADNASAALDELHNRAIDAVILDIHMPGIDGLELLGRIKGSPRFGDIPVVMLTGLEDRSLKRRALNLGASDLLNKPVNPEDLVARIRSVLRLKAYQDELKASKRHLGKEGAGTDGRTAAIPNRCRVATQQSSRTSRQRHGQPRDSCRLRQPYHRRGPALEPRQG